MVDQMVDLDEDGFCFAGMLDRPQNNNGWMKIVDDDTATSFGRSPGPVDECLVEDDETN